MTNMDSQTHETSVPTVNSPSLGSAASVNPPIDSKIVNGHYVPSFLNGNVTLIVPPDLTRPSGERANWLPFGYSMVSKRRRFACPLCQLQKVSRQLANYCDRKIEIAFGASANCILALLFLPSFLPSLSRLLFRPRAQPNGSKAGSTVRDRSGPVTPPSTTTGPMQSRYLPARFRDRIDCRVQSGDDDDDVSIRKM